MEWYMRASINKGFQFLLIALFGALIAFAAAHYSNSNGASRPAQESVYARVIRTGVLRCGYFSEAPFTIIDPNTGKKSGIAVEIAEKIADELGVKLEWVSAENFGELTEDLRNGRYDAICASTYNLPRGGRIDYTVPYAYVPVFAYTQAGRSEFDNKLDQIDWSQVTIGGRDGEGATTTAQKRTPQAKFVVLPQTASIPDMLEMVVTKKADMTFVTPAVYSDFAKTNPNALQKIAGRPFHVFNVSFGLKPDEAGFKNILDLQMRNMASDGYLDELFRKYDPTGLLFRPAALYRVADDAKAR